MPKRVFSALVKKQSSDTKLPRIEVGSSAKHFELLTQERTNYKVYADENKKRNKNLI